jgi:hypothetical protein
VHREMIGECDAIRVRKAHLYVIEGEDDMGLPVCKDFGAGNLTKYILVLGNGR